VIDVAAVGQLVTEVQQLEQELEVARNTLTQAQQAYAAITGGRGMQLLLANIDRNYLPTTWVQLQNAMNGAGGAYGALAADVGATVTRNAVLTPAVIAQMDPQVAAQLTARRRSVALLEALARASLANTSNRFASIQQLINAIPTAVDEKGILDLQARIGAEEGMLQNENTKLQELYRAAQVESETERERSDELALASIGTVAGLPPMGLN
jgi:type IV secretion system protein VirB5